MDKNKTNTYDLDGDDELTLEPMLDFDDLTVHLPDRGCNELIFQAADGNWVMKIGPRGKITFNREDFPDLTADQFSLKVIEVLESIPMVRDHIAESKT